MYNYCFDDNTHNDRRGGVTLNINYIREGWYQVESTSVSGKHHYAFPRQVYCSCQSTKLPCKHINEIAAREKDGGIGIQMPLSKFIKRRRKNVSINTPTGC